MLPLCLSSGTLAGVLIRRNALIMLMSVEIMLNAANMTLLTFARMWGGTEAMSAQRSTPMMLAPSRANRTACDRPWPRATPVMNATLPLRLGMTLLRLVSLWSFRSFWSFRGD